MKVGDTIIMENKSINNENDKTYKSFLMNKKSFLELLHSFVDEKWVNIIDEKDLELVNKSFILKDYEDRESDIIYKLKTKDKNIYFYIVLELQSTVDFTMPFRLLIYMTELWKQIFLNTDEKIRERKDYRLPAIVPLLLYNGKNNWTVNRSFKEMQDGYELFGEHVVDFKYILFDINRYNDEELIKIGNLISSVFLLDKSGDAKKFIDRLRKIGDKLKSLDKDQFVLLKGWLELIVVSKLPEDKKEEFKNIIKDINIGEGDNMVMNLEIALDEMLKERAIEIARNAIEEGIPIKSIIKITGLSIEEIEKLIEEMEE